MTKEARLAANRNCCQHLAPGDKRRGQEVARNDLIAIKNNGTQFVEIKLPSPLLVTDGSLKGSSH